MEPKSFLAGFVFPASLRSPWGSVRSHAAFVLYRDCPSAHEHACFIRLHVVIASYDEAVLRLYPCSFVGSRLGFFPVTLIWDQIP